MELRGQTPNSADQEKRGKNGDSEQFRNSSLSPGFVVVTAGNLKNSENFQISSRCFIFQAEDLDFPLENLFPSRFFNFPAEF